jgi:predicted Ser/Thr protein kinase
MPELSPGLKLSHYQIVSKLGAGGMGEVYLAQDTKLDRKVALKILRADLASHRDRMERVVRVAKSAAALSHSHIAQIFEIGETDGTHFISMEYIDGVTLPSLRPPGTVGLGDKDTGLGELEKAYSEHEWFMSRLKVDPFMDPLRDDPRFKEMLKCLNLPE